MMARQPHQRDLAGVEQRRKPKLLQMAAAGADELDLAPAQALQRAHQVGAQQIAGLLAGDDGNLERPPVHLPASSPVSPTTKRPSRSARATISPKSSTSERPASTPMPTSPAAWAASTVAGPIVGKIGAQFLVGLGALDQNAALAAGDAAVVAQVAHPFEQQVGALDAFKRDGAAANGDRCLADVQRTDGARRPPDRH